MKLFEITEVIYKDNNIPQWDIADMSKNYKTAFTLARTTDIQFKSTQVVVTKCEKVQYIPTEKVIDITSARSFKAWMLLTSANALASISRLTDYLSRDAKMSAIVESNGIIDNARANNK